MTRVVVPSTETAAILEALRSTGLVTLGVLPTRQDVFDAATHIMHVVPHEASDPDGLTAIRDTGQHTGREGFAGLGRGEVLPHTERSSVPVPPRLMMLVCVRPAPTGGVCLLADGHAAYDDLADNHPEALAALSEPRSAFFGGGDGTSARSSPVARARFGQKSDCVGTAWRGSHRSSSRTCPYCGRRSPVINGY